MTTRDRLRRFIIEELDWNGRPEELTDDYPLIERDVIDSMGIFQIISFVESEYDVEILDEDLMPEKFQSIRAIADLVEAKRIGT